MNKMTVDEIVSLNREELVHESTHGRLTQLSDKARMFFYNYRVARDCIAMFRLIHIKGTNGDYLYLPFFDIQGGSLNLADIWQEVTEVKQSDA